MGKLPPIVTVIVGIVLVIGANVACFFLLNKPRQEELTKVEGEYQTAKATADTLPTVEAQYAEAVALWEQVQAQLADLMARRSVPISFHEPVIAMFALWKEYREVLPKRIEQFVKASGVQIIAGASFPAPPGQPPPTPTGGFLQIPEGAGINLQVKGSLEQIERLYRSISRFDRVMTIESFGLQGQGSELQAQVAMKFYLLTEVPAQAPAPDAAEMGAMPGGAPGMPGGTPGAGPPPGVPAGPAPQFAPDAKGGKAGGDKPAKEGGDE